jgi:predicted DNA-binding antitoxin AbrB/MazE fold protein
VITNLVDEGESTMTVNIEAIYEDGVLRPTQPLPLKEHETVRITDADFDRVSGVTRYAPI